MLTMTARQWKTKCDARKDQCGGDLWNEDQIWRKVFSDPNVVMATVPYMGTGLWCDVHTTRHTGITLVRRVFA